MSTLTIDYTADVGIYKYAFGCQNVSTPNVGRNITYYIYYYNRGAFPASNVTIIDYLPHNVEYKENSANGTYNNTTHTVTWYIGDLMPVDSWRNDVSTWRLITLTVFVNMPANNTICNNISIMTSTLETDYANNNYTECFDANAPFDPNIKYGPKTVKIGEYLNYLILYYNEGNSSTTDVWVIDEYLDDYLNEITLQIDNNGTYNASNRKITWKLNKTLMPGETGSIAFRVKVREDAPAGAQIKNNATIIFWANVFNFSNSTNTIITTIGCRSDSDCSQPYGKCNKSSLMCYNCTMNVNITGKVFNDANNNSIFDESNEKGIPNVEVQLSYTNGTIVSTTRTDNNGDYKFDLTIPCQNITYIINVNKATLPQGASAPSPSVNININQSQTVVNTPFGVRLPPQEINKNVPVSGASCDKCKAQPYPAISTGGGGGGTTTSTGQQPTGTTEPQKELEITILGKTKANKESEILVTDKNGNPVANSEVVIGGEKFYTDASGKITYKFKNAGELEIFASAQGYNSISKSINVSKRNLNVTVIGKMCLNDMSEIKIVDADTNEGLSGINVTINGVNYTTDSKGIISYVSNNKENFVSIVPVGKYLNYASLTTSLYASECIVACTEWHNLTVIINTERCKSKEGCIVEDTIEISVVDEHKELVRANVSIYFNKKKIYEIYDDKFEYKLEKEGKYIVNASKNCYYNGTATINVKEAKPFDWMPILLLGLLLLIILLLLLLRRKKYVADYEFIKKAYDEGKLEYISDKYKKVYLSLGTYRKIEEEPQLFEAIKHLKNKEVVKVKALGDKGKKIFNKRGDEVIALSEELNAVLLTETEERIKAAKDRDLKFINFEQAYKKE
ncbi:MAG: hypothetical protein CVT88_07620 [Candidatus Altiarchaeales archaeon HGW-Altiarchaeales-1]|nr:MAG: hypothetical protein CVT88_07620 [Candidatus Altiarchaeales archaeon HGW-Altiarchaeales-1]